MLESTTQIRVRYVETDRMGVLYHGHYATFYEVGRTDLLRGLGITYRELEDAGVLMPVTDLSMKFLAPAHYDELITVKSRVLSIPGVRMIVQAEMENEAGKIINRAEVKLTFLAKGTGQILSAPANLLERLQPHFT